MYISKEVGKCCFEVGQTGYRHNLLQSRIQLDHISYTNKSFPYFCVTKHDKFLVAYSNNGHSGRNNVIKATRKTIMENLPTFNYVTVIYLILSKDWKSSDAQSNSNFPTPQSSGSNTTESIPTDSPQYSLNSIMQKSIPEEDKHEL